MEQIDMTKYLPCTARLVGGTLYILDGEGRVQRRLDPLQTAIEWFQMSNDAFYARYGVNWVPKEPYYSQARRMVHSGDGAMREMACGDGEEYTFSWALWYGGGRASKSTHQWKRPK